MVRPEYPRPLLRRQRWTNLNGEWEFGSGDAERFDRRIMVPFCPQSAMSGIGDPNPGDVVWYRRRFDAPAAARLLLHFGAVDYRATVWVNGEEVASHEGGHTPFSVDVTTIAGRTENVLVVRAEDPLADRTIPRGKQHWKPEPEGIFYTATTGIWQTVWLEPLPSHHIESLHVSSDLDSGTAHVDAVSHGEVDVVVTFDGRAVGRRQGSGEIALDEVHAWSPAAPHLYTLRASLGDEDLVETYFGLRKLETRDGMFWLNHEPFVQRLVMDQGYYPGGLMTAPSDQVFRRDIELARSLGFNGARKHQKVEDPRFMYWADRLGFVVWGEMASFRSHSEEAERRLTREWLDGVRLLRQHPSIVVWVPINESDGLSPTPAAFLEDIHARTKQLDATRLVVSNDGFDQATTDLCTLHDYAGARALARRYRSLDVALEPDARIRPPYLPGYGYRGEPMIISEFGGVTLAESGGFGYSQARGPTELLDTFRDMVRALMDPGPVEGFCYTQLVDVEQERNGLCTFDRTPKIDPVLVRAVTQTAKRR